MPSLKVISLCMAAPRPKEIDDSICAFSESGLTDKPQSIAQTMRSTLTSPLLTETSATCATKLPKDSCTAIPRNTPLAKGFPQLAFSAAKLSAAKWRGLPLSKVRRYSSGSFFAACANSSTKLSITNAEWLCPTERHHSTGTPVFVVCRLTR